MLFVFVCLLSRSLVIFNFLFAKAYLLLHLMIVTSVYALFSGAHDHSSQFLDFFITFFRINYTFAAAAMIKKARKL